MANRATNAKPTNNEWKGRVENKSSEKKMCSIVARVTISQPQIESLNHYYRVGRKLRSRKRTKEAKEKTIQLFTLQQ
jgi:hypothetical protein